MCTLHYPGGSYVVTDEQLDRMNMLLNAKDDELKSLGMVIFYEIVKQWPDDTLLWDHFRESDWLRTLARLNIVKRRVLFYKGFEQF